ncbi:MAG: MBL fold metallo-hydrolase [Clostridia bacterium]|nr:MBL fold metallo-hydrolase [Clostridia bacterium]
MKLLFLGTGAADWTQENEYGERRRFSSALIDEILLIDPNPQALSALADCNKDQSKIRYILNTHRHADHYCKETVKALQKTGARLIKLKAGKQKRLGRYEITAVKANHGTAKRAVHFFIRDGEKTLFYGLDGAWLSYEEWRKIVEYRPDFAVLDGTIGFVDGDERIFEHNDLHMVLEMKKTLSPFVKRFCISHLARTLHPSQKQTEESLKDENVLVAYDGMEIEI